MPLRLCALHLPKHELKDGGGTDFGAHPPHARARKKSQAESNEAYVFVTSLNFQDTVETLREGLIKNGFERQEISDLIHWSKSVTTGDLFAVVSSVTFT